MKGVYRPDHWEHNKSAVRANNAHDESKQMEKVKDSTATLSILSVLIVTVTFGATFVVPAGGYNIADDHNNGAGTATPPIILAQQRRYASDAFIASNTLAFVFSTIATVGLMHSGAPFLNPRSRKMHLTTATYLVSFSIACLAAAFALGAYVVLAPVAHKTAAATCVLTSLVLLYPNVEFIWRRRLLLPPLRTRKGLIWAWVYSAYLITANSVLGYWPLILIFGWAAYANPAMT